MLGLRSSIRSKYAFTISTGDRSRRRIPAASSVAGRKHKSFLSMAFMTTFASWAYFLTIGGHVWVKAALGSSTLRPEGPPRDFGLSDSHTQRICGLLGAGDVRYNFIHGRLLASHVSDFAPPTHDHHSGATLPKMLEIVGNHDDG